MQIKARKLHKAFDKLKLEGRNTSHRIGWFVYNNKKVLFTKLSHGGGEVGATNKIRQQLKLNEEQFRNLIGCPLKREGYIKILKDKGLIK